MHRPPPPLLGLTSLPFMRVCTSIPCADSVKAQAELETYAPLPRPSCSQVCLFSMVCANAERLFEINVGDEYVCEFSHEKFRQLKALLLAGPAPF